jgi:hypothetical protein
MTPPTPDSRPPTPDSSTPDPAARRFLLRRAAIAPLCLCLVAGLHAMRVVACGQTQWKGGGFGMFSTVESEAARFVRAFAVTDEGEWPLAIPNHLDKTIAELRAAPTAAKADAVARRLAALHWRRPDEQLVREADRWTNGSAADLPLPMPVQGLFRSLEAIPSSEQPQHAVPIRSVRVECWRLRLDRPIRNATEGVPYSALLTSELIRQATAEAAP